MLKTTFAAAVLLSLAVTAAAQDQAPRPMTTDDGLNMVRVSSALMSPDGQWVLYQQSELDWKENKRTNKYYMVPSQGGEAYQYIGEDGGSAFQFSPDGRYISFRRSVDDKQQLFIMRTSGGGQLQMEC
jgi:dipeptidyl aminopeptidase/acylaminoacyl peptidase